MDATFARLIKSVGIPDIVKGSNGYYDRRLMHLATTNKIQLLYALGTKCNEVGELTNAYDSTVRTVCDVSRLFSANGIDYAVFKTIKPFPYTPSDIDLLISDADYGRAKAVLEREGYTAEAKDALCTTMRKEMDIDLYLEPSVSNMAYLRRDLLMNEPAFRDLDGTRVRVLTDHAEFIAVISHSLYKEQMLTLNDYYALTILAEQAGTDKIMKMADETNTVPILQLITGMCRGMTEEVFGDSLNLNICKIAEELGAAAPDVERMPHKFPMKLAMGLLFKKVIHDGRDNHELLKAVASSISLRRVRKLWEHLHRETY